MKKIKYILLTLLITVGMMTVSKMDAKAVILGGYNGTSRDPGGGGVSSGCHGYYCRTSIRGVRVTIVYYDGKGSYQLIGGGSKDFFPQEYNLGSVYHGYQSNNSKFNATGYYRTGAYNYAVEPGMGTSGASQTSYWSRSLVNECKDAAGHLKKGCRLDTLAQELTGHSLSEGGNFWSQETEAAVLSGKGDIKKKGYRVFLEPIVLFKGGGASYIMSMTEYAISEPQKIDNDLQFAYFIQEEERFATVYDDVGIKAPSTMCPQIEGGYCDVRCCERELQFFGSEQTWGHALHIVDISNLVEDVQCSYDPTDPKNPEKNKGMPIGKTDPKTLTDEEKDCCDQQLAEIAKKIVPGDVTLNAYKTGVNEWLYKCVLQTEMEFHDCVAKNIDNLKNNNGNTNPTPQVANYTALDEFKKNFPACLQCDEKTNPKLASIEKTYRDCVNQKSLTEMISNNVVAGMATNGYCDIQYSQMYVKFVKDNPICSKDAKISMKCKIVENYYYGSERNIVTYDEFVKQCGKPKECVIINNKFVGLGGRIVTKERYNKECGSGTKLICKVSGGQYYGKDGYVVDEKQYFEECEELKCIESGGKYYGKEGNVVDYEQYLKECKKLKCTESGGKYYGKEGNVVDREQYLKECEELKCIESGGKYYGKEGNVVDREQYLKECEELECIILEGKYYGKDGEIVDAKQYLEECDESEECSAFNPKDFPPYKSKSACCVYFERKIMDEVREEVEKKGFSLEKEKQLSIERLDKFFNDEEYDFRKNCLEEEECKLTDEPMSKKCCKELMEKYPEFDDYFWYEKKCKEPDKDKCKWEVYASDLPNQLEEMEGVNCKGNTEMNANDTDNWDCIFESDNIEPGTKKEMFKDYYVKFNNPYCAVYCREDINYKFPNAVDMIVKAGNHFTVGETGHTPEWRPVKFTSVRTCRTSGSTNDDESKGINEEKFKEDWEKANDAVITAWDEWKVHQQKSYAYEHDSEGGCCAYKACDDPPCECTGHYRVPQTMKYKYFGDDEASDVTPDQWCPNDYVSADGSVTKVKPPEQEKKDVETSKNEFFKAKHDMETIEYDMLSCTSWDYFDKYRYATYSHYSINDERYSKYPSYKEFMEESDFSPDIKIDYDEPTYDNYDYKDLLKKKENSPSAPDTSNFSTTGAVLEGKYDCYLNNSEDKDVDRTSEVKVKDEDKTLEGKDEDKTVEVQDNETCTKTRTFNYSSQKWTYATYTKTIDYQLKDNVFNYIMKPQGIAVTKKTGSSKQLYVNLGYSALHVHFKTPTGNYPIGLSYPKFTPKNNKNSFDHNFDVFKKENDGKIAGYDYECTYTVHNEIIENEDPNCVGDNCEPICTKEECKPCGSENCDPLTLKGLNLIYRPISLSNPFPGVEGTGRTPGINWNGNVDKYITNNRGVEKDKVYFEKEPMYKITLTPALIKEIRKYNSTTTYNDWNMECDTRTARDCKSKFIRESFERYFEGCGTGAFNDCGTDNEG